jgi:hypothetical protein
LLKKYWNCLKKKTKKLEDDEFIARHTESKLLIKSNVIEFQNYDFITKINNKIVIFERQKMNFSQRCLFESI